MKKVSISNRAINTPASAIRKLYKYANAAKKRGVVVHHLNIGQPDIATPPAFFAALRKFTSGSIAYAPSEGYTESIRAWQKYYKTCNLKFEEDELMVTTGGSEAILFAMLAITDPGDEIIVFEPLYTNYVSFAQMAGVKLVPIRLRSEDDFQLPEAKVIKKKITAKTKAIIICNPSNPTGTVIKPKEARMIVKIARERNLFIISDEPYRELIFNGLRHISFAEFASIRDRVVIVDSVSKRFNLCGARVGCLASKNKQIVASAIKFGQGRLSSPTIEQLATVPLLNNPKKFTKSLVKEYKLRRDVVVEGIQKIPGTYCPRPQGAFYAIVTLPVDDAEVFSRWMLEKFSYKGETVMLAPGNGFYVTKGLGKREVRIAFVLARPKLKRAMEIIRRAIDEYSK